METLIKSTKNGRAGSPCPPPAPQGRARTLAAPSPPHAPWPRVKLGEVCSIDFGTRVRRKDSKGGDFPVYGGGGATFNWPEFNREDCCIVSRFAMSEECVRFVKGKFFLNDSGLSVATNDKRLSQEYLDWCLMANSPVIFDLGRGTAQRNLDVEAFASLDFPLPPLPEQRAIVAKLERELAAVDAMEKKFEEMEKTAETGFKAELKEAFEALETGAAPGNGTDGTNGTTATGTDATAVKRDDPTARRPTNVAAVASVSCPSSPSGPRSPSQPPAPPAPCRRVKLGEVCDILAGLAFKGDGFSDVGTPICGGLIISPDRIKWEECKHWPTVDGLENYLLKEDDVVVALDRPWINEGFKVGMIEKKDCPCLLIQRTARLRSSKQIVAGYIMLMMRDKRFREHCTTSGTTVPHISHKDVASYEIPLPPLPDQRAIVVRLDAARVRKEKLVAAARKGAETAGLLRKALLKEAFE